MDESVQRKERSEKLVRGVGGDVNDHLPRIEDSAEVVLRKPKEVAYRALCLTTVAALASGQFDPIVLMSWVEGQPFATSFSERENAFITDRDDENERNHKGWQIEAAVPLYWALQAPLELGTKLEMHDPFRVLEHVPFMKDSTAEYYDKCKLRPVDQILNEADLIYRAHWAARNEQLGGKPTPKDWDYGVVMERHKALNWLVCYCEEDDWDEVTTDT